MQTSIVDQMILFDSEILQPIYRLYQEDKSVICPTNSIQYDQVPDESRSELELLLSESNQVMDNSLDLELELFLLESNQR